MTTKTMSGTVSATMAKTQIAWKDLPPKSVLLMLQTKGGTKAKAQAARSSGRMRTVIIDGALVEMQEKFILGQIANGTITVVYPGTNIPWDPTEDRHPNYPPDWFPH